MSEANKMSSVRPSEMPSRQSSSRSSSVKSVGSVSSDGEEKRSTRSHYQHNHRQQPRTSGVYKRSSGGANSQQLAETVAKLNESNSSNGLDIKRRRSYDDTLFGMDVLQGLENDYNERRKVM
mmetsp:Transcript_25670/g.51271  ORF Transcript_25670/g.51271 Transcript_25670/m.51271 type:complete len:122 (-) Transcript_25670:12-377(-)